MPSTLVLALWLLCPPLQEQDEEYFEEEEKAIELAMVWDFRFINADAPESWLDAALGKGRYGGDGTDRHSLFRIPQASFVFDTRPTEALTTHVQVNLDVEPEHPEGRYGWDRIRLIEAFVDWRPRLSETLEFRSKGGFFFPPISLENIGVAWSTFYTITPSAINAWVGEEVRATGAELGMARVGLENEVSATGAIFWNNDPTGSLLAYRGFAIHDRQMGLRDRVPLPPTPSIQPGGAFEQQAPFVEPVFEIDDRPGYYGALSWENYQFFELNGIYFDNRGDPSAFDGEQYAWQTRFANIGMVAFLPREMEVLGQFFDGNTDMGPRGPEDPRVTADFRSWYLMFTAPFGRHRLSTRYERFRVRDRDTVEAPDPSDEDGDAWTFAYLVRLFGAHRVALELTRIASDRPARASMGLPPDTSELMFQLSLRLQF